MVCTSLHVLLDTQLALTTSEVMLSQLRGNATPRMTLGEKKGTVSYHISGTFFSVCAVRLAPTTKMHR